MKCSLGIANFLKEISSLSHSIICLYFFAMITEEGFLISPCYSLEPCIQMGVYLSISPLPFAFLLFSVICKACSDNHFFPFCIYFSWGWSWLLPPVQCHEPPSIVLQVLCLSDLTPWIYLSLPLYNCKGFWFRSYLNGLVIFPIFFNLSLNFAIRSSWSEPQSAPSLVFADCIELLHLWLQRI